MLTKILLNKNLRIRFKEKFLKKKASKQWYRSRNITICIFITMIDTNLIIND